MAEKKVTVNEKFVAVVALLKGEEPAIEDFDVEAAIEFLEDRAAKAIRKPAKRKVDPEVEEFRKAVATYLADAAEPVTAKMVGEALEVSVQKASAALRALVAAEVAAVIEAEKGPKAYVLV